MPHSLPSTTNSRRRRLQQRRSLALTPSSTTPTRIALTYLSPGGSSVVKTPSDQLASHSRDDCFSVACVAQLPFQKTLQAPLIWLFSALKFSKIFRLLISRLFKVYYRFHIFFSVEQLNCSARLFPPVISSSFPQQCQAISLRSPLHPSAR